MNNKRNILLTLLAALLLIVPAAVFAQDTEGEAEDDLPDCPAFEGEAAPVRISYYMGEGTAFQRTGQLGSATFSYTCIIEVIDPSYIPAYIGRANIYTRNRDYDRAIEDLTTIIDLDSQSVDAYNNRGIINALIGEGETLEARYADAIADFEAAIAIDGGYVPALNNRAIVHVILEEYDEAIAIFEEILANSNVDQALTLIRNPEDDTELPDFSRDEAQAYAMLGLIRSAQALDNYDDYLTVTRGAADGRIQSAAGALESRFTFELRVDDGSYFIVADFAEEEAEVTGE
ncbi:MAG: tetratricopeptide repeat protein [Chloroflexota bacterium]